MRATEFIIEGTQTADIQSIADAYSAGSSTAQLASQYNTTAADIRTQLQQLPNYSELHSNHLRNKKYGTIYMNNVIAAYARGDSILKIAKEYNSDKKTLTDLLKRLPNYSDLYAEHWANAQYSPTAKANFTSEQIKRMADMYAAGSKLVDIARKFGVTSDSASRIIQRHYPQVYNVAREPGAPGYAKGITPDMIQHMKHLRDSGMSLRDIGAKYNLDHKTVLHHLRKLEQSKDA